MSKKIILLALAAASVAACALPATAMAVEEDIAVHVVPKPEGAKVIDGEGNATLTGTFGTVTCTSSNGSATFTTSTTGSFEQTFHGCTFGTASCNSPEQPSGTITTTELPFHLVTAVNTGTGAKGPGVLVTPNNGHFASFVCGGLSFEVGGNGLVGTIKTPECGKASNEATVEFSSSSSGVQTHKTVASTNTKTGVTPTEYSLTNLGLPASEDASGIITLNEAIAPTLECT